MGKVEMAGEKRPEKTGQMTQRAKNLKKIKKKIKISQKKKLKIFLERNEHFHHCPVVPF
jgi:hypothetical protein